MTTLCVAGNTCLLPHAAALHDAKRGAGMFLIASLGAASVYRFLIVLAVVTALYLVYGIHAAAHHDRLVDSFTARCGYFCPLPDARFQATRCLTMCWGRAPLG